jgi:multidrug resistance efflux pump
MGALLGVSAPAWARSPAADLQRELDAGRAAVADLERLDDKKAVTAETAVLRAWYDEGGNWLSKEEFDRVREVLDRCNAQSELIRQKISAARAVAQANEREAALKSLRAKLEQTKQDLQQAQVKKKAMEMNSK